MAEETQKQDEKRKPAIRTMRSDAEELFKTAKPSLIQMIGREPPAPAPPPHHPRKTRYAAAAIGLLVLAATLGAGFLYLERNSSSAPKNQARTSPGVVQRVTAPPPYFATETSRTITVKKQDRSQFLQLIEDSWKEKEREGTVKRIIINLQDGPQERNATLRDFFELWRITPPAAMTERLDPDLMVFIYYGQAGARMGFAVRTREPERTFADMLTWEPSLLSGITQFFFDERPETVIAPFEDRTWRNIDWRYLKLSQERDLGTGYTVFPVGNILIFTTSKDAMETIINRLFDAR